MTPRSRSPVPLLGALTGLTALSIAMSLPALPTLAAVTAGGALVAYAIGAIYNRTALPLALGVGISAALAGITCFMFLSRLATAAPPGRPQRQGESEC